AESVPPAVRLVLPESGECGQGVPVGPHTSAPHMLVRRGLDWLDSEDDNGADREAGMLMRSIEGGKAWVVYWANGGEGTYATGRDDKYELEHLQVHANSGAPVRYEGVVEAGAAVVRGMHWMWDTQDGGIGSVGSVQIAEAAGCVAVRWPNRTLDSYPACQDGGFSLNYFARPVFGTSSLPVLQASPSRSTRRGPA
ncbi:hypothetical protein TSOC_014959, partial [Tetrabaena socialis]